MRMTVLGGSGALPTADEACSGFLVERDGFRLLIDAGYAVFPRLLRYLRPEQVDAVIVSHGHPDHCADVSPLVRARALSGEAPEPLALYAPAGALEAVLALDRPEMIAGSYRYHEFTPGDGFELGPFAVDSFALPHSRTNAGLRVTAAGRVLAYTGDCGPDPAVVELARGSGVFVAEASFVDEVPGAVAKFLSSARQAGRDAAAAGAARLVLTHLLPETDPADCLAAARREFDGPVDVARSGLRVDLDPA